MERHITRVLSSFIVVFKILISATDYEERYNEGTNLVCICRDFRSVFAFAAKQILCKKKKCHSEDKWTEK